MDKTEKLKNIILKKYGSIRKFAKIADIPSTTLTSSLDRGIGGMGVDRVIKICDILNIDVKTFEPIETNVVSVTINKYSKKESVLLNDFNKLNEIGKNKVINYTQDLKDMPKYKKENSTIPKPDKKRHIWEEEGKEYLMPIACHNDGLSDEEKENMDNIINNFLKKQNK